MHRYLQKMHYRELSPVESKLYRMLHECQRSLSGDEERLIVLFEMLYLVKNNIHDICAHETLDSDAIGKAFSHVIWPTLSDFLNDRGGPTVQGLWMTRAEVSVIRDLMDAVRKEVTEVPDDEALGLLAYVILKHVAWHAKAMRLDVPIDTDRLHAACWDVIARHFTLFAMSFEDGKNICKRSKSDEAQ